MSDINTGVEQWGNDLIERAESAAEKYGVECHGVPLNVGWFLDLLDAAVEKERADAIKEYKQSEEYIKECVQVSLKGKADAIEKFREYLKTVIICEMPQDMWELGVDNTCDRMLKEQRMNRCDECKHKDSCVCVPYGCECFEIDLEKYAAKLRAEGRAEIQSELMTEVAMLNETKMTEGDLKCFAYRIKAIAEKKTCSNGQPCTHPNCKRCGTTHFMSECDYGKEQKNGKEE